MTKLLALAALALSSVACSAAGEGNTDAVIHPLVVERAIARWDAAAGVGHLIEGYDVRFVPWTGEAAEGCDPGSHACTMAWAGRILVRDDGDDDVTEQWLVHEFGHALLGACATPECVDAQHAPRGIMHQWWGPEAVITSELLETVCAVQDCQTFAPEAEQTEAQ